MRNEEPIVKAFAVPGVVALLSTGLCLCANLAGAQSATPAQASTQVVPAAPLQLQLPPQPVQAEPPAQGNDNAIVDAQDSARGSNGGDEAGRGPQVHGSFTTGIGYSKGYGTSTVNAADVDIHGQSDSGRTYDLQIHVMQGKGSGFGPGYYGLRHRGY